MNIYNLTQIETPRLIIRPVEIGDEIELNAAMHSFLIHMLEIKNAFLFFYVWYN